jgi:RNA polymerase sigma factor (sigma-70 family)
MDWPDIYAQLLRDPNHSAAWEALQARVRPWARSEFWTRGWHVVEDAVADTCSAVVISLERARGGETFAGFVYGHFRNVRRRILREPAVRPLPEEVPAGAAANDVAFEPTEEEAALLDRCLEELPPRERRAVMLRYYEDAAAESISATVGVTVVNARRLVCNGLARLRECVRHRERS